MTTRTVLIAGAGVAGLASAWWLARAGWTVTVVERAPSLRNGGYMIGLSGPGYASAERMGLLPRLSEVSYEIQENVYRDRKGREFLRLKYRDFLQGLPYLALERTDLIAALFETVPDGVDLRLATELTSLETDGKDVSARLSDGAVLHPDLVIAADGLRSQVRSRIAGEHAEHYAHLGYRFAVYEVDDTLGLGSDFLSFAEPGHLAEYYALRGGRLAAMHVWRDGETGPVAPEARWNLLEKVTARSAEPVRAFLQTAKAGPPPLVDSLTMVDLPKWSQGRVLLLGDAAHCLTLVSGQGAGMALASAEILAEELARSEIDAALVAHEQRLRPAITRLQTRSRRMAGTFVPSNPVMFHLRNTALKHMPKAWLGRYLMNAVKSEILLAGQPGNA
ncbi:FAD-dependent oxidoreductase [Amorphus sp. 3PC139-8]|uniref:FAD-dependent oxidoreductase n=1 Tax=Amorphus sp. 3PC139-8 TaxID=2735676 RepID=UPI00345DA495